MLISNINTGTLIFMPMCMQSFYVTYYAEAVMVYQTFFCEFLNFLLATQQKEKQ